MLGRRSFFALNGAFCGWPGLLGDETVTQHCRVLDTDAFDIVIGTDFLRRKPQVKMLSLQLPYSLHCDFGSGLFSVPLELSGRKESGLSYASKTNHPTENYQLARHVLENGLAALQVNLDEIRVEMFASRQQHIMQLYCSKHLNNAFRFFWKAIGLAYANPPFSLLPKVLTEIAYEAGRVVMCTPDWGCSGEHTYWRRMLDRMTVGRESFIVISTLCVCCASPAACCWCRVPAACF